MYREKYIEIYEDIYGKALNDEQDKVHDVLGQCFQQMFRKYYYSPLEADTLIAPANIVNTLVEREFGRDTMALPLIKAVWDKKRIKHLDLGVLSFGMEDHFFVKDMEHFLWLAKRGAEMDESGIIADESRSYFGENMAINDRHYLNIISLIALKLDLLSIDSSNKRRLWKTNDRAYEFLALEGAAKLKRVLMGAIKLCSESIINSFPELSEEFSEKKIEAFLKKPAEIYDIYKNALIKLDIDFSKMVKLLEKGLDNAVKFSESELNDMADLYNLQTLFDIYFTVPFGYYLQLIQPVYPEMYDIYLETGNILENIDDFQRVRTLLFTSALSYDLTALGEKLLLNGGKVGRKHALPQDYDKVYVFKAKLFYKKRVWREIEIMGSDTLHKLHEYIRDSFRLEHGHLYSFFMSNKAWDKSSEYCHPQADGRSAAKKEISSLNLSLKQKFMFLYDYGDEYKFELQLAEIKDPEKGVKYPLMGRSNKPSVTICDECKSDERPVEWYCCDHEVHLCDKCADNKKHEDCYTVHAIV
jgi:hypothetical protein